MGDELPWARVPGPGRPGPPPLRPRPQRRLPSAAGLFWRPARPRPAAAPLPLATPPYPFPDPRPRPAWPRPTAAPALLLRCLRAWTGAVRDRAPRSAAAGPSAACRMARLRGRRPRRPDEASAREPPSRRAPNPALPQVRGRPRRLGHPAHATAAFLTPSGLVGQVVRPAGAGPSAVCRMARRCGRNPSPTGCSPCARVTHPPPPNPISPRVRGRIGSSAIRPMRRQRFSSRADLRVRLSGLPGPGHQPSAAWRSAAGGTPRRPAAAPAREPPSAGR